MGWSGCHDAEPPAHRRPREQIAEFCRRHHIRRLAFFGSVLRDDFTPDSDVDVLVEFELGKTPGFAFVGMEEELSQIPGRRVVPGAPPSCRRVEAFEAPSSQLTTISRPAVVNGSDPCAVTSRVSSIWSPPHPSS